MPCYRPLEAWRRNGGVVFAVPGESVGEFQVPCGNCIGCKLERSRQWAVRCMHEAQMHESSVFCTFTYSDDFLPYDYSLNYLHFQKFLKRLRFHKGPSRFFMCGEYGEQLSRPHYHAILFGLWFDDMKFYKTTEVGDSLYTSVELDKLWSFGQCYIGMVTFESAAYVARYCTKKVTGCNAEEHYQWFDQYTGEVYSRLPEFAHMSLKPGIGATWFEKYRDEVYPRDRVVVRGREQRPPKYYDELLRREKSLDLDDVELERYYKFVAIDMEDNSPERMVVKEEVKLAQVKSLRRS